MKSLLMHRGRRLRKHLRRFTANRSGNVAILFSLSAVVMMLAIGGAVDIGRWLNARTQTIAAVDAAVLAGARALQTDPDDTEGAVAAAQNYYNENVATRLPVTGDTVTFAMADDGKSMTASGTAYIKTPFLQFAGIDKLPLLSTATADFAKAGSGIPENLEISLMLDVTGSMEGDKLEDLKEAAKDLVNIIVEGASSDAVTKIALVPFSEDVRPPTTTALDKARGTGLDNCERLKNGEKKNACNQSVNGSTDYFLSPCVVERSGAEKYTDAEPKSGQYVMAHYVDENNTTGRGSNKKGKCVIPQNSAITPLSTDADALKAKIDGLQADGGTAGHIGTAWAWYMLSPNWASLWPAESQPVAYDTPNYKKIAILMTDGEYNTQYDKNGVKTGSSDAGSAVNGTATNQAKELCTAIQAKGIKVYTILFDQNTQSVIDMMKNCASPEDDNQKYAYTAEDGLQLKQAFRDIGLKLSKLYLSK
jgi:Flp pilus assembly protein TadG